MLLIKMIVYVLLLIKTVLSSILTYAIPWFARRKPANDKVKVKKCTSPNRSPTIKQNCVGCQSPQTQKESVSRFLSKRKLTKKDLENASFFKPTLSSLLKKNCKPEVKEEFEKTLRKYKKCKSTNSITSPSRGTRSTKTNQTSSNEDVSDFINKQLCYATTSEVEQMDEVVNYLPPIQMETCVPVIVKSKLIEPHEVKITQMEVYRAVTVRQYESDDSQIFTDESPDEYPRSTPESTKVNESEDSQIYTDEDDKENLDNSREVLLRQRIENNLAKIDRLAQEVDAENDPLYRSVFNNLRNATIYLCRTSDDYELGKKKERIPEASENLS